eukprot:124165-Rhodomonas_salina.1
MCYATYFAKNYAICYNMCFTISYAICYTICYTIFHAMSYGSWYGMWVLRASMELPGLLGVAVDAVLSGRVPDLIVAPISMQYDRFPPRTKHCDRTA